MCKLYIPIIAAALLGAAAARADGGGQIDSPQDSHPKPKTYQGPQSSQERRAHSDVTAAVVYSPFGLLLPGKRGLSAGWIVNKDWTIGAEYMYADLSFSVLGADFASLKEELSLATARWYPGNSFHLTMGFGRRRYEASLGADVLARWAPAGVPQNENALAAQNEVAVFGVGNHWQIGPGFTFGADWLDIYVTTGKGSLETPLLDRLTSDEGRKTARKALKVLRYAPSFALARLDLGWSF